LFRAGAVFRYDRATFCAHLPHGRDARRDASGAEDNLRYIKRKHQCLDTELLGNDTYTNIERKVGFYTAAIQSLRERDGRVGGAEVVDALRDDITGSVLWIGCGLGPVQRAEDVVFDHVQGRGLIGLDTPFDDDRFDIVVNVDMWRSMPIPDLCLAVAEGLRVARTLVLVESRPASGPLTSVLRLEYLQEALASRTVRVTTVDRHPRLLAAVLRRTV
jgi:hypothetical protein